MGIKGSVVHYYFLPSILFLLVLQIFFSSKNQQTFHSFPTLSFLVIVCLHLQERTSLPSEQPHSCIYDANFYIMKNLNILKYEAF